MPVSLALLCDTITPILFVACLGLPWYHKHSYSIRVFVHVLLIELSLGFCVTYGLMALDNFYGLWPRFGLDYSTHSAFALTLALPLLKHHHWAWGGLLLLYGLCMNSLGYHSWADILTSVLFWLMLTLLLIQVFNHLKISQKKE
ncbi:MAG: hypothetical protein RL497_790 [Pseudomonadota bacterium]|jgi:hypothetical protein